MSGKIGQVRRNRCGYYPSTLVALLLMASFCACKAGSSNDPAATGAASHSPQQSASGQMPTILGEHFTVRTIIDRQQGGLPVGAFIAPAGWQDHSEVVWNYTHQSQPVAISVEVEKPGSAEAFYSYPTVDLFWLRPVTNYYRVGQNFGGLIFGQPISPQSALVGFAQHARGRLPNFHIVAAQNLPNLPQALHVTGNDHPQGLGVKVTYVDAGRPIEEEFYGIFYSLDIPYDGPQGRTWQTNWGLKALHSFRAPQGTLESRRAVFAAMAKSFRPNPAWGQRYAAIGQYLAAQFNQNLQAGYDQIAAAGQLSRQISANNDAMLASIDARLQSSQRAAPNSGGGVDGFDDYIRGVDTTNDPYYGTSQHSNAEQYHWTDGYGTYRNSNDATYNPNQNETGSWVLMESAR